VISERGIAGAASEFGMADVESCIRWLVSTPLTRDQIEILASHLTVGETYFFREKRSFEVLETHILPQLLRVRGERDRRCASGVPAAAPARNLIRSRCSSTG